MEWRVDNWILWTFEFEIAVTPHIFFFLEVDGSILFLMFKDTYNHIVHYQLGNEPDSLSWNSTETWKTIDTS